MGIFDDVSPENQRTGEQKDRGSDREASGGKTGQICKAGKSPSIKHEKATQILVLVERTKEVTIRPYSKTKK